MQNKPAESKSQIMRMSVVFKHIQKKVNGCVRLAFSINFLLPPKFRDENKEIEKIMLRTSTCKMNYSNFFLTFDIFLLFLDLSFHSYSYNLFRHARSCLNEYSHTLNVPRRCCTVEWSLTKNKIEF